MERFTRRELLRRAFRTAAIVPLGYVATTEVIHAGMWSRFPLVSRIAEWLEALWPH